jgi:tRNA modification GTPase
MHLEDTIIALASAPGPGTRAIVRLSGPHARQLLNAITDEIPQQRGVQTRSLRLPDVHGTLPADVYYMPGPHSYTGQDCAEIHTISSPPLVDLLIATLLSAGGRSAKAGEFTMRAFLAGKKDLTQAEAVLAVIEAGDRGELTQALAHLAGGITQPLHGLRDDLLNLLADVEAGLDFAEEDITFVDTKEVLLRLGAGMAQLINVQRQLVDRSMSGKPYRVALIGAPNAGKSSLFNSLAGHATALVSPVAGTTRDYLTVTLSLDGVTVELIDTAGMQTATDTIEVQAQGFSQQQAHEADLRLWCIAADVLNNVRPHEESLVVWTKCDRATGSYDGLATSALTGHGIAELRTVLREKAKAARTPALAPSISRCRHHLDQCLTHLRAVHHTVLFEEPAEIMALELRLALDQLGEMVGAIYTDDLLDRIFSRFCIGK